MNNSYKDIYLQHHGINGQRWGKKNGPPYPLNDSDHSASEKKAGWKKSLDKKPDDTNKKKTREDVMRERGRILAERGNTIRKNNVKFITKAAIFEGVSTFIGALGKMSAASLRANGNHEAANFLNTVGNISLVSAMGALALSGRKTHRRNNALRTYNRSLNKNSK